MYRVAAKEQMAVRDPIWPLKASYLLDLMAMSMYVAFINVYLRRIGFTGKEIGLVAACGPIVALISQPFWGTIADERLGRTRTLRFLILMAALLCPTFLISPTLGALIAVTVTISFFSNSVVPMMDSISMSIVRGDRSGFASIRLWGTIGGAVSTLLAGFLFQKTNVAYMFYIYSGLMLMCWLVASGLPRMGPGAKGAMVRRAFGDGFVRLIRTRSFLLATVAAFLLQVTNHTHQSFFGVYLVDTGAAEALVGTAWLIASASELLFLLWLHKALARFDARVLFAIGAAVYSLRWLVNSAVGTPGAIVFTQLLNGGSLTATYLAAVSLVDLVSPSDLKASGQTIFVGLTIGGSAILGNIVGGALYDSVGLRTLYLICSIVAAATIPLFMMIPKSEEPVAVETVRP